MKKVVLVAFGSGQHVENVTVIELLDWEEADRHLAVGLAKLRETPVAISFHDGAGETELYAYVGAKGRGAKPPSTILGTLASSMAWDLRPSDRVLEMAVLVPLEPASRMALAHIQRIVSPILVQLGFRKTRVEVRYHPSIDAVFAWSKKLSERDLIQVRYDFCKGEALHGCDQTVLLVSGEEETELAKLKCDRSACWHSNPELVERDFELFAAQLLKVLDETLPESERDHLLPFKALLESYETRLAQRRVVQVIEPNDIPAEIGFRGERLLTVRSADHRMTFKFDTSCAPESGDVSIGDIVELRGGSKRARRLGIGEKTFHFDEMGAFLRVHPD